MGADGVLPSILLNTEESIVAVRRSGKYCQEVSY